jgi:hypothetical protein
MGAAGDTRIPKFFTASEKPGFPDSLSGAEHPCRRQRHLLSIWGDHPAILIGDLIASPVGRVHRVRINED